MAEELLQFLISCGIVLIGLLFYCWIKLGQEADRLHYLQDRCAKLILGGRKEFWKSLGAYKTENGRMYLDLEGIRLVIFEGEIEGWYIP